MDIILGVAGITVAIVFGVIPLIQKYNEKEEEKKRSQALLTPVNIPGSLQLRNVMDTEPVFMLELENIGSNPCRDVEGRLQSYNMNDVNGVNERPIPVIDQKIYATNPIGTNQRWIIKLSRLSLEQSGVYDIHIMASGFLILALSYYDIIKKEKVNDRLCWQVDGSGDLTEVTQAQRITLIDLYEKNDSD